MYVISLSGNLDCLSLLHAKRHVTLDEEKSVIGRTIDCSVIGPAKHFTVYLLLADLLGPGMIEIPLSKNYNWYLNTSV